MSYDIYLRGTPRECPHCGRFDIEPDCPNPTYNLTEIFDLALTGEPLPNPTVSEGQVVLLGAATDRPRGLRVLSGRVAADTLPMIAAAQARMADPAWTARFAALAPANGWGTVADAVSIFATLHRLATECPTHTWEIH